MKVTTNPPSTCRDAFAQIVTSPYAPPRFKLGDLLIALYDRSEWTTASAGAEAADYARAALIHVFAHGKMKWGVWKAAKAIYKRAEERHDLAMFGVLGYRIDAMQATSYDSGEIGFGTILYLRRRVWRYLRKLGTAVPEAFPTFACEVLRHYPASHTHAASWVAAQIWGRKHLRHERGFAQFSPPTYGDPMVIRAYPEAWKLSPAPLLRLLDVSLNDLVCDWAIRCLRADHPLALRAIEPSWLARLGRRPVASLHAFVVALIKDNPELHMSKLRAAGLHDVVVGFLRSPHPDARTFALEYAAAHAPEIPVDELVALCRESYDDTMKFASARLEAMTPAQVGLANLIDLLGREAAPWAPGKLGQGFHPRDVPVELFVETAARDADAFGQLVKFYADKSAVIPAAYWITMLDDQRFIENDWSVHERNEQALTELGKRSAKDIGIPWIQKSLEMAERSDAVSRWLDAGMLSGPDLDLEWVKRLVGKPRLRPYGLKLLGDRRRVEPAAIGLPWLLDLARSPEQDLAQFAQRMLLEAFQPADFADGDAARGVARLWELATGAKSKEAVRTFAATYLKAHHPDLGPRQPEAKALGIKPRLDHDAYKLATVKPLLADDRQDVRKLGVAIAAEEFVRWNDRELVYELANSTHREPRSLGAELLLGMLAASPRLPLEWLDSTRVFQLAEGAHKASREVALTLIRRMYDRVGGAEKLAWLMDSPERDVRLFAVRLFWDRHRPKPWPADYTPRKLVGAPLGTERFSDLAALQQFARVILFGLPPGRVGERDPVVEGGPKPERALPASVAKRRLIEAMRDVALEDGELAKAIAPVLGEFTHSTAKGEWHASVQALTQLRKAHADLEGMPS
ncbi:MAG: hypothetical protein NT062_13180 [Proteobacteria bacterium]|nr:hypothetical protein [Pseudomonadota bacterium]